jgi:glutathione S-transferase
MEASFIVEHRIYITRGPVRLLPEDGKTALWVRMMDRFFGNYIMTPVQKLVSDRRRPEATRDRYGVADAKTLLDTAYRWLDDTMAERTWAAGGSFSLADCAAAPFLFYADWAHEIDPKLTHVRAYRARRLARSSFARGVAEARPYPALFPLGTPNRDRCRSSTAVVVSSAVKADAMQCRTKLRSLTNFADGQSFAFSRTFGAVALQTLTIMLKSVFDRVDTSDVAAWMRRGAHFLENAETPDQLRSDLKRELSSLLHK